ncbi:MAG TPA: DnaJ domain-containing protein [Syntrophobacteria bacterium]|nr:DnaJ domain-containing protein [Syntrophobacteria bacterium]
MNKLAKVLGVGLGYLAAGPVGAVIGYFVGEGIGPREEEQLLVAILLGLTATVLRVQGVPPPHDRRRAACFISRLLRCDAHDDRLIHQLLEQFLPLDLDIKAMARSFSRSTDRPMRRQFVEILATVCRLQGQPAEQHLNLLARIAAALDLPEEDWETIMATVLAPSPVLSLESCFALLELIPDAPPAEVKRAYRRLAKRYHPDRSSAAPPHELRGNTERLLLITTAYQTISENQG